MIRPLTAKEASYLSDTTEFTNFAYSFVLDGDRPSDEEVKEALRFVSLENPLLSACINLSGTSLVFVPLSSNIEFKYSEKPLDVVLENELATPLAVFSCGLFRVTLAGAGAKPAFVFTFAHAAFDGAVAAHIVFEFVRALHKTPSHKDALHKAGADFAHEMVPKKERTWPKFVRFVLNLLGLYYFLFMAKPKTLRAAASLSAQQTQELFESLREKKGIEESALHAQLTRITTRHLTPRETSIVIQRAKALKVSVTSLLAGAMGAAIACDALLPPLSSKPPTSRKSPVRQISLLAGLAVNGRPARSIPPTVNGAFNYVLLLPHVSINITDSSATSRDALIPETDIQSLLIAHELKARLHRNEPFQMARFLPSPQIVAAKYLFPSTQTASGAVVPREIVPKLYQLAPEVAKDSIPVGYTLSNVGNFTFSAISTAAISTSSHEVERKIQQFRFVSTMRCDINTRRVELSVVTLDGCMTISLSRLNGMVGDSEIALLLDRFLVGLLGSMS